MNQDDDIEELAAEYVVGTLSSAERDVVNLRRVTEPALDQEIARWERRLAPLLDHVRPVDPPRGLLDKINASISEQDRAQSGEMISLSQHRKELSSRTRPWRVATGAMTALAASLAGFLVVSAPQQAEMSPKYVAVLQEKEHSPAFLMSIDMKSHMCAIKTVISPPNPDKSYELWMVHETWQQPKSLGLIARNDMEVMPMSSDIDPDLYMNATFAVSLEPAGGSPTGQPTGPVMYAGKLVQSTP